MTKISAHGTSVHFDEAVHDAEGDAHAGVQREQTRRRSSAGQTDAQFGTRSMHRGSKRAASVALDGLTERTGPARHTLVASEARAAKRRRLQDGYDDDSRGEGSRDPMQSRNNASGPATPRRRSSRGTETAARGASGYEGQSMVSTDAPVSSRTRRHSIHASAHDAAHQEAPSLASLIGEDSARALDSRFGSLQPVREKRVGEGIHPWERDAQGKPLVHAKRAIIGHPDAAFPARTDTVAQRVALRHAVDLEALKQGTKRYIWAVGRLGRIIVAEELQMPHAAGKPGAKDKGAADKPRYAGHPLLVGGGPARVSGELQYDAERDCLVVLDKSGRYSRYADRRQEQVDNVTAVLKDVFSADGMDVVSKKVSGKAAEPLVYPTLA